MSKQVKDINQNPQNPKEPVMILIVTFIAHTADRVIALIIHFSQFAFLFSVYTDYATKSLSIIANDLHPDAYILSAFKGLYVYASSSDA